MQSWKVRAALCLTAALAVTAAIVSVGPARAEVLAILSCGGSSPCLEWVNSKNGDAIKGVSTNGVALEGRTQFNSSGKTLGKSGVLGADASASGALDSGVTGTSVNGTGVTGTATGSAGQNGVAGFSASTFGSGVYGQNSSTGFGVAGRNTSTGHNNGAAGVLADGGPANDGLHVTSAAANGVYAFAQTGTALFANQGPNTLAPELYLQDTSSSNNKIIQAVGPSGNVFELDTHGNVTIASNLLAASANLGSATLGSTSLSGNLDISGTGSKIVNTTSSNDALTLYGGGVGTGSEVFSVRDSNADEELVVDDKGDTYISGFLIVYGGCQTGCVAGGKRVNAVTEYAPLESEPTIEDNGEATLFGGFAYVPLDPKFANVMDKNASYLVSVTPEGDCNGLYVAQRTPSGFAVRELRNGRESLGFEYRIVAKRYGERAARLPMTGIISRPPPRRLPRA
jgi:hypothetical protein